MDQNTSVVLYFRIIVGNEYRHDIKLTKPHSLSQLLHMRDKFDRFQSTSVRNAYGILGIGAHSQQGKLLFFIQLYQKRNQSEE